MKKNVFFVVALLMVIACGQKKELIVITGWEKYQDQYTTLSFAHPAGWHMEQDGRSIAYFSSPDVVNRFVDLTSEGKNGAKLTVSSQKLDTVTTLENYINRQKEDRTAEGYDVTATEPKTAANLPALMLQYNGYVTKKAKLHVAQVCALRDSFIFTIKFEAFNEAFDQTKQALDSAVASLILPEVKVVAANVDPSIPAKELKSAENKYLKISIPANFDVTTPSPKAPTEFTMDIKGYRQDCYIRIDVIPAQKLSAEKVVEQNSKFYKSTSKGETTIDGIKTAFLNYSPMKGIQSRVYFLVKNDKIYRIISNYFAQRKADFAQPFEKTIASIAVK